MKAPPRRLSLPEALEQAEHALAQRTPGPRWDDCVTLIDSVRERLLNQSYTMEDLSDLAHRADELADVEDCLAPLADLLTVRATKPKFMLEVARRFGVWDLEDKG